MSKLQSKGSFNPSIDWKAPLAQNENVTTWSENIKQGNVVRLAQAITLLESDLAKDIKKAQELLMQVPIQDASIRIGVSGAPGAGKSTLIEQLGLMLCEQGHRVAVLAIDPSSQQTGGSILGDKTRMENLSKHPNAFIRPSPTKGVLGGVGAFTREASLLCELAGFEIIIIETVGVGQSEYTVRDMVDLMVLILSPGAGDDLQGIKKGILEVCDLLVVNKADGEHAELARKTYQDYKSSGASVESDQIFLVSAIENTGIIPMWEACKKLVDEWRADHTFITRRSAQDITWFHRVFEYRALKSLWNHPVIKQRIKDEEAQIRIKNKSSIQAAFSMVAYIQEQLI